MSKNYVIIHAINLKSDFVNLMKRNRKLRKVGKIFMNFFSAIKTIYAVKNADLYNKSLTMSLMISMYLQMKSLISSKFVLKL
jgi:hypothetical protein